MADKSRCIVCDSSAALQCSRCKAVHYCGVEHQKSDWKAHKSQCKGLYEVRILEYQSIDIKSLIVRTFSTFQVRSNATLGRHLVASCDISENSEIFNEHPLVFGPKFFGSVDDLENAPLKCIGCFKTITGQPVSCPRCHWPACTPTCAGLENAKLHGLECSVLALGTRLHISEALANPNFFRLESILPLKCLLMQLKNPNKFNELMSMESHLEQLKGTELYKEFDERIVQYLNENFLECLKKYDDQSEKKVFANMETKASLFKLCGIIETNAICIRLDNEDELNGIYKIGCLLEHSCTPNCYFSIDMKNGFKLKVRAGREIAKGEHISIMYTNCLWGTQQRQEHLRYTKCFTCRCARCTDPTELKTNFSSLKCLGAKDKCAGYHLPANPTDPQTEWVCSATDCEVRLSNHQVFEFMQNVENDVEAILANEKATISEIESAVKKLSSFLHPNHYHNFALRHKLVQLYGFQPNYEYFQLPMESLDEKISVCKDLLAVIKALDPNFIRLSVYAGTLALELYNTLRELKRRGIDRHDFVGMVKDYMEEILVFGRLTLEKDLDVPEARQLYDRMINL